MKRERGPDQEGVGFSRSDSLVGLPPRPGATMLLENDRVRVFETALAPGERTEVRDRLDTAVYVIDGGSLRIHEGDAAPRDAKRESTSGHWLPAGRAYALENVGPGHYREISVELK